MASRSSLANKALLAHHGAALFQIAREHEVSLLFEAAVCGGIPIIKALNESFVGNRVRALLELSMAPLTSS